MAFVSSTPISSGIFAEKSIIASRNLVMANIEQIAKSFELTVSDSQTLLFQFASSRSDSEDCSDQFANPLQQLLNQYLHILSLEIEKTVDFASRTYRTITPSQLLLMGDGARIPSLEHKLASRLGLPTLSWSIDLSRNLFGEQHISSFAIAAGLSSLAWETT